MRKATFSVQVLSSDYSGALELSADLQTDLHYENWTGSGYTVHRALVGQWVASSILEPDGGLDDTRTLTAELTLFYTET